MIRHVRMNLVFLYRACACVRALTYVVRTCTHMYVMIYRGGGAQIAALAHSYVAILYIIEECASEAILAPPPLLSL